MWCDVGPQRMDGSKTRGSSLGLKSKRGLSQNGYGHTHTHFLREAAQCVPSASSRGGPSERHTHTHCFCFCTPFDALLCIALLCIAVLCIALLCTAVHSFALVRRGPRGPAEGPEGPPRAPRARQGPGRRGGTGPPPFAKIRLEPHRRSLIGELL